ncbi:molybdopterin molybdotransferase MoeA [Oscillatoria amoena NRMC-F 0135]|nr:molybdopterin molybdotransferase MoeA [Oscillatoria amoena NRMC-F 0135]
MVSVQEAVQIIRSVPCRVGTEEVRIHDCVGRVLAEPIVADRDFPPFNRVAMDGIAIKSSVFGPGKTEFQVEGFQAAGSPVQRLVNDQSCIEVMTGAVLPEGTDAVVRYEDLSISGGLARINIDHVISGLNIHPKAQDATSGEVLLKPGQLISPAEVALLASVGKNNVLVYAFPKTVVISTGDELVPITTKPEVHQVRRTNVYALQAAMKQVHWPADEQHLPDQEVEIRKRLADLIARYHVLILSGGVSKGKFDFIPKTLTTLGVEQHFHQVSQRPGKPFWFGSRSDGKVVFALPGNPVSTYVCFYRYILPWMMELMEVQLGQTSAILSERVTFAPNLTYFLQVSIFDERGKRLAKPVPGGGSGDFVNLKEVDGFVELPADKSEFKKGESFPYISFRWPLII